MPDVTVVGECADAHEVLDRVRAGGVDVVLLDIQMPELSGIEALQLFPADGPVVIFCTAHTAHAVAAFDLGAIDYLLKPIEAARLRKALERARDRDARRRYGRRAGAVQGRRRAGPPARSPGVADRARGSCCSTR
jgi:two-component system LytT family response regulator